MCSENVTATRTNYGLCRAWLMAILLNLGLSVLSIVLFRYFVWFPNRSAIHDFFCRIIRFLCIFENGDPAAIEQVNTDAGIACIILLTLIHAVIFYCFLSRLIFTFFLNDAPPKDIDPPMLIPKLIPTKSRSGFMRHMVWMHSVRRWELAENWKYKLPASCTRGEDVTIVIPKGFEFDGASVPRPFWAILHPSGLLLIQALVHDFAYRCEFLWEIVEEKITDRKEEHIVEEGQGEISPGNIITRKIVEEKPGKVRKCKEFADKNAYDILFREIGNDVNGVKIVNFIAYVMLWAFGGCAWKRNRKSNTECKLPEGYNSSNEQEKENSDT